jgi:hypothetical protein
VRDAFPSNRKDLRRFAIRLFVLILTAASIEGISNLACHFLQVKSYFFYEPASLSYDSFRGVHDPLLGWSAGHAGDMAWDKAGSRIIPAFPDPFDPPAYVSLYGNSWTWSWPVDAEHAYSNQLAILLGKRVHNFGICGYGTDQAYLRFVSNRVDTAPIVILGVLSENILRNVTGFLDLINPASGYGLKPHFTTDRDGRLEMIPATCPSRSEFLSLLENPEHFIPEDYFAPYRWNWAGIARIKFPFSWFPSGPVLSPLK